MYYYLSTDCLFSIENPLERVIFPLRMADDLIGTPIIKELVMQVRNRASQAQVTLQHAICAPPINGCPQFFCCWHSANVWEGAASCKA